MVRDRDGMDSDWGYTPPAPTPYKYNPGDTVYLQSCVGIENTPCTVHTAYTSDSMNHLAPSHRRYVVIVHHPRGETVDSFSEIEFSKEVLTYD